MVGCAWGRSRLAVRRPGADRTGAPAIGVAAAVLRAVSRRLAVADSRRTAGGQSG